MANTTRPSVPPSHASESEHRRQIANVVNIINQTTPNYSRTDAEIAAGVTPVDYRYPEGDVRRYGAVGDGTTDDTTAIQAAIDSGAAEVVIPAGTYKVTTELGITRSVRITMHPGAVIDISDMAAGATLTEKRAFYVAGSEGSSVSVTSDIAVGDDEIVVNSTSTFAAGDWVSIRSDELYMDGVSGSTVNRGHITQIKSIDSSTELTLVEPSPFAYTAAENANIRKYTMIEGVEFRGGKIQAGGVGSVHSGIIADYTHRLVVDGMAIDGAESYGVRVGHSSSASVRFCDISDCTSPTPVGNTGYGVAFVNGTRNSEILRNRLTNCRHAVAGGGSPLAIFNDVVGNTVIDCGIEVPALDVHEPCFWWVFRQNFVQGGAAGMGCRGQYITVDDNDFSWVGNRAIRVHSFDTNTDGQNGIRVTNNRINGCSRGIYVHGKSGEIVNDIVVRGNTTKNCSVVDFFAEYVNGLTVTENEFDGGSVTITNFSGEMRIEGNSPRSETATGTFTADIYILTTDIDSGDGAVSVTLPNGTFPGQRKIFTMSDASNSSTVSVTTHETSSPEVFTFAQTSDVLVLEWTGALWWTVKNIGVAT